MLRLTKERERRGWSRAHLGQMAGTHPATVGKIENRRLVPYAPQLRRLAMALGVREADAASLLDEVSDGEAHAHS